MLAGNITQPGRIELIEIPEPQLPPPHDGPGEILFQPELGCLCGSDIPYFQKTEEHYPPGIGHSLHEMIGTVVATNGKRLKPGDRVLAVPTEQRGLFERYVLSEERAIPLATNVPEEHALMAQPLGTVIYALKKLPNIVDQNAAVVGVGPMGQLFCAALANLGVREIIAVDVLESRLELSRKMGATATVCNARENTAQAVQNILGGTLADLVVEVVGHDHEQMNLCIDLCRHSGRILSFGVPPAIINGLRWRDLFLKNITVHTSVNPDFKRDFPLAMQWISEGRIDVGPIITHRYPLAQIQEAFELFRDRRDGAVKVLIDFPSGKKQPAGRLR